MWKVQKHLATWQCIYTPRGARVCVCACVISEIKYPFQDNANSLIMRTLYTRQIVSFFIMWDYVFCFCAQVMWQSLERSICVFNHDRRSSLKSRGTRRNLIR